MNNALRLVFWELTARCNLKCKHCRAEAQEDFAQGELNTAEILRVARQIRADADPIMVLTGGEPLARDDFFEIATACTAMFSRVALATNGTTVDDRIAQRIVSTGIKRVSISIDGACAATHDSFRGQPGSFAAALRGFDALKRAGASLQVNVTVSKYNQAELAEILQLSLDRGAEALHVFMLVPVGCGAELSDDSRLSPAAFEQTLQWLAGKAQEYRGRCHIKPTCAPQYYRIVKEMTQAQQLSIPVASPHGMEAMTRGCLAGSGVCFISRTGDVQPCGYLPLVVGNVRASNLGAIWNDSEVFKALRDTDTLTGKCGVCGFRKLCQGCRARAHAVHGDYLAEEPDCPYRPPTPAGR